MEKQTWDLPLTVGDRVWIMHNDKPIEVMVGRIVMIQGNEKPVSNLCHQSDVINKPRFIKVNLTEFTEGANGTFNTSKGFLWHGGNTDNIINFHPDKLFNSKKELLESL